MVRMPPKFKPGARVRLRDFIEPAFYGDYACTGNEGIIRAIREDRFGLPEVYIQWDKNHWAYNGAPDRWTYEDHFELVEDSMSSQKDQMQELMAMFAQGLDQILDNETPANDQAPQETNLGEGLRNRLLEATKPFQEESKDEEFAQAVEAARERLSLSSAFIIVGIDQREHPAAPDGVLEPFAFGFSKIPEGDALVTSHMSKVAANAHQNLALQLIALSNES